MKSSQEKEIKELKEKNEVIEKVIFEIRNVNMTDLDKQFKELTKSLEEKVSPIVTEQPVVKTSIESFQNELSKVQNQIAHFEQHALDSHRHEQRLQAFQ